MGNVTAGMLKTLISIWRAGDADPKRLTRFEEEIGPLVRTARHYFSLSDDADVALDKWDEFFEVQIVALVKEAGASEGALGAALWHGVEFTMLNLGFEKKTDLFAHLREVRDREWPRWCARYRLPSDTPNLLYYSEPKIYEYMELGREALAERLNGPLFAFEQPGGSLQTALIKFNEAMRAWLDALPSARLTEVYVAPRLLENDDVVADEDLIDWLSRGETVFVQAGAGMGKSMFLRHFGLRLLDAGYLPLWIEPGDEILAGEAALASYLTDFLRSINRFDIPAHWIGLIAEYAHQHRRIIALVEEGEKWNRRTARRTLKALGDCARSVLVVGRASQWPPSSHQVALGWGRDRLEQIMLRRGNAGRFAQLEAWVREGRMLHRPWEYGIAAEIKGSEPFDSPVEMLEQALAEITTERSRPGEARSYRSLLRAEAWREITDQQAMWKTVGHNNKKSALWACEMRVMYESADDTFRFSHDLWRSFFAADHAIKQKYTPEEITAALVGVRDWEQTIAWIIDRAAHDSKRNKFAGALLEAVAGELSRTWRGSGWLQGAQAVGAALCLLEGYESTRRVRTQAEQSLLALLPPTLDDEVVSRALLALTPLSQAAVDYLWHEVFSRPWQSVQFVLLEEPGIARRLLSLDSPPGREDGVYLLWRIARSPNVDLAQLVAAGERWHSDARRRRVSAISSALCIQGTDAAAWRLATWLEQEAQIDTDADFADKLRKNLEEGLRLWSGSRRALAKNMATLFRAEIPGWIWRPVLDAMLRDRDAARPILRARLDDPNVALSPDQREALNDEVNFWRDDTHRTFDAAAAPDLYSPWCLVNPQPWEIAASFFEQLANDDGQLLYVLDQVARQDEIAAWAGEEHEYAQGLRAFVLDGALLRQAAALTWLARMPSDFGRGALNRGELVQFLDAEWVVQKAALDYFAAHRREDVLDVVQEMCERAAAEAEDIENQMRADGWSEALMHRREEVAALQRNLATALRTFEDGGSRLVSMALGEGVAWTRQMVGPTKMARNAVVRSPQHFETLVQVVVEERAPEWWLTAAIAAHSVILEDADGEFVIRQGEKRFLLHEWVAKQTGSS